MNEKPRDDLTVIKGIGPVWQRRLQESLGVRTFQDLAALSSEEILSGLKPAPAKSECEAWIHQAQELAAAAKPPIEPELEIEEGGKQTNSPAGSAEWKPVASFVVEFLRRTVEGETGHRRTKVHHMETDADAEWLGLETVELCRWMLEQMGETALPELKQYIEEIHVQAQDELEKELEEQRVAARRELERTLEREQARARQALQNELAQERAQARQELEQERIQARQDLEQELDERRTQVQLELEQMLEEERAQARQELEQEAVEEQRIQPPLMEPSERKPQTRLEPEEEIRPQPQPPDTLPVQEPHVVPTITQLRAFQPSDVARPVGMGIPGQPFLGLINSDESITFAVDFELAEPTGPEIVQRGMTYYVQFYVRDLSTGAKEHLGNTRANVFVEGRSSYIARLTDVTLKSGVYELSLLVTVQNKRPRANYMIVPLLQVA